ncbi:uncharacterized protein LOC115880551 [Sitophilus oryzae]|uniref:Uncharacterized protein LOC115880551 n=1 Tax=Sitophilus oryzae TaxID=7048 RepID=A0A6J2XRF9_SITOR|nr:uncharacterized protein LOC115880551 [Sitophilus oryzae]
MKGTGGGPAQCVPLSELENRLLNLMETVAVEGDNVAEMGFGQVTVIQFLEPSVVVVTPEAAGRSELISSSCGLKRPMEPNLDHDYTAETSGGSSRSSSAVKRQVKFKPSRRIKLLREGVCNRLIDLSEETLNTLKCIEENTRAIAESFKAKQ